MKRIQAIIILVVIIAAAPAALAQIYSDVDTVSIMSVEATPGDTVLVYVDCVNTFSVAGISFRITYNEEALEIISVDTTSRSNLLETNLWTQTMPGVLRFIAYSQQPWENKILPGSGPITVLKLRIFEDVPLSYCYLRFEDSDTTSFENALSDSTGSDIIIPVFNDGYVHIVSTGIDDDNGVLQPSSFELSQNYPNPFNMNTRISFSLENRNYVTLDIYNILGEKVATLYDGQAEAGETSVTWNGISKNGNEITTGVYFYKLAVSNGRSITKRMSLIK